MGEELSNDEKLQIAQHFLLSSPPCQFNEILKDVRKILPANLLSDSLAAGIARAFNVKNGRVVISPAGNKVALATVAEIDPTHYHDPVSNQVFAVDHLTLATSAAPTLKLQAQSSLESKRSAIQSALKSYLELNYKAEMTAAGTFVSDNKLVVVIVSEKPNLRNYWSGRWGSVWTIDISGAKPVITGEIKIHAHYFEDGNIQLNTTRPSPAAELSPTGTADEQFAAAILAHIDTTETKCRGALDDMFTTMNEDTLKAMRRILPISGTKMQWNVNAVKMNRQVAKK